MKPAAWRIFLGGLQLSCLLLIIAVFLLILCGGDLYRHLAPFQSAMTLNELAQSVLLVSNLLSAIVEDLTGT